MAQYIAKSMEEVYKYIGKIVVDEIVRFGEQVRKALKSEVKAIFYGRDGFT